MAVGKKTVAKATAKKTVAKPAATTQAAKDKTVAKAPVKSSTKAVTAKAATPAGKAAPAKSAAPAKTAVASKSATSASKSPAKAAAKPVSKPAAKPAAKVVAKPAVKATSKSAVKAPAAAPKAKQSAPVKNTKSKTTETSTKTQKQDAAKPTKVGSIGKAASSPAPKNVGTAKAQPSAKGKSAAGKALAPVPAKKVPSVNPKGKDAGTPIPSPAKLSKATNRTVVRATDKATEKFAAPAVVMSGPNPVKETSKPAVKGKEKNSMITNDSKSGTDNNKISIKSAAPQPQSKPGRKLKPEDLVKLKQMLLHERERIVEEMRTLDDRSLTPSSDSDDSQQPGFSLQLADSATDNIQVETDLAIRNIEAEQLIQIDDALRSIETGDYGTCNRCQQNIDFERLKAKPNARYCVACLRLLEAGKA